LGALKVVRERAQSSKDTDLKAHISTLYDSVLSLKEALMLVTDENHELRLGLQNWNPAAQRGPELRQVGAVSLFTGLRDDLKPELQDLPQTAHK
jgi:hypothetical protein